MVAPEPEAALTTIRKAREANQPELPIRLPVSKAFPIDLEIFRLLNARTLARLARGEELGAESSLVKLLWASVSQRLADTAVAALGPDLQHAVGDGQEARLR